MITQSWNIYSYAIPIVQQFFGINPMASEKKVTIKPQMPSEWKKASLENVIIADNEVSIYYDRTETHLHLKVDQINPDWTIDIVLPRIEGVDYSTMEGHNSTNLSKDEVTFSTSEKSISLKIPLK
jgi:hypothetical protein